MYKYVKSSIHSNSFKCREIVAYNYNLESYKAWTERADNYAIIALSKKEQYGMMYIFRKLLVYTYIIFRHFRLWGVMPFPFFTPMTPDFAMPGPDSFPTPK